MIGLFTDLDGRVYSAEDISDALHAIGADDCETLFIHSDVMFGSPSVGFRRKEYLNLLYQIVKDLETKYIVVPTFTYSFCNKEDYDVRNSRTSMGAFNEYVRKMDGRYRTLDPLLSISVPMELKDKFEIIGQHSLGKNSGLDIVHHMDGAKFLFLGADLAECFTYVHYVEKMMEVPYRFDMSFEGNVIGYDGLVTRRKQFIHTQCGGVKIPQRYEYFETDLQEKGLLKKKRLGNKFVSCISEEDAYREIENNIKRNINYYLEKPFTQDELIHKYTYDCAEGRITHC